MICNVSQLFFIYLWPLTVSEKVFKPTVCLSIYVSVTIRFRYQSASVSCNFISATDVVRQTKPSI